MSAKRNEIIAQHQDLPHAAAFPPWLQPRPADLSACNTLGLTSRARVLVHHRHADDLLLLSDQVQRHGRAFVLGGGSNVVLESELDMLVIKVEARGIRLLEEDSRGLVVEAGAGEDWHAFLTACGERGWHGLENLALIPGTVGAAPVQNIGAYGLEIGQRFHSLLAWDLREGRMVEFGPADCGFAYRDSFFKRAGAGRWLIHAVRFRLPRPWQPVLSYAELRRHPLLQGPAVPSAGQIFDAVCAIRRAKLPDPAVLGNAGSFFKNPVVSAEMANDLRARFPDMVSFPLPDGTTKLAAAWLIEQSGWKGRSLGPVGMHGKQALVLVNTGGATARDVRALAQQVQADVRARYGVELEREPIAVG